MANEETKQLAAEPTAAPVTPAAPRAQLPAPEDREIPDTELDDLLYKIDVAVAGDELAMLKNPDRVRLSKESAARPPIKSDADDVKVWRRNWSRAAWFSTRPHPADPLREEKAKGQDEVMTAASLYEDTVASVTNGLQIAEMTASRAELGTEIMDRMWEEKVAAREQYNLDRMTSAEQVLVKAADFIGAPRDLLYPAEAPFGGELTQRELSAIARSDRELSKYGEQDFLSETTTMVAVIGHDYAKFALKAGAVIIPTTTALGALGGAASPVPGGAVAGGAAGLASGAALTVKVSGAVGLPYEMYKSTAGLTFIEMQHETYLDGSEIPFEVKYATAQTVGAIYGALFTLPAMRLMKAAGAGLRNAMAAQPVRRIIAEAVKRHLKGAGIGTITAFTANVSGAAALAVGKASDEELEERGAEIITDAIAEAAEQSLGDSGKTFAQFMIVGTALETAMASAKGAAVGAVTGGSRAAVALSKILPGAALRKPLMRAELHMQQMEELSELFGKIPQDPKSIKLAEDSVTAQLADFGLDVTSVSKVQLDSLARSKQVPVDVLLDSLGGNPGSMINTSETYVINTAKLLSKLGPAGLELAKFSKPVYGEYEAVQSTKDMPEMSERRNAIYEKLHEKQVLKHKAEIEGLSPTEQAKLYQDFAMLTSAASQDAMQKQVFDLLSPEAVELIKNDKNMFFRGLIKGGETTKERVAGGLGVEAEATSPGRAQRANPANTAELRDSSSQVAKSIKVELEESVQGLVDLKAGRAKEAVRDEKAAEATNPGRPRPYLRKDKPAEATKQRPQEYADYINEAVSDALESYPVETLMYLASDMQVSDAGLAKLSTAVNKAVSSARGAADAAASKLRLGRKSKEYRRAFKAFERQERAAGAGKKTAAQNAAIRADKLVGEAGVAEAIRQKALDAIVGTDLPAENPALKIAEAEYSVLNAPEFARDNRMALDPILQPEALIRTGKGSRARKGLENESVTSINPKRFLIEATQNGDKAAAALAEGDISGARAFTASKVNSLRLHKLAAEITREAAHDIRGVREYANDSELGRLAIGGEHHAAAARSALDAAGVRKFSHASITGLTGYAGAVKASEFRNVTVPRFLMGETGLTAPQQMTPRQVKSLRTFLDQVKHVSSTKDRAVSYDLSKPLSEAASGAAKISEASRINSKKEFSPSTTLDKQSSRYLGLGGLVRSVVDSTKSILFSLERMDDFRQVGPSRELVYRPLKKAADRTTAHLEQYRDAKIEFEGILRESSKDPAKKDIVIPELAEQSGKKIKYTKANPNPALWSKLDLIALALYQGSNAKESVATTLGNRGLSQEGVDAVLARHLTRRDWDAVQLMWKFNDTVNRPLLNESALAVDGASPEWVEPVPFVNSHGDKMPGGYHHLVVRDNPAATTMQSLSSVMTGDGTAVPGQPGIAKARVGPAKNTEYSLDWSTVEAEMLGSMATTINRPAALDSYRVAVDPQWSSEYARRFGANRYNLLVNWLNHTAGIRNVSPSTGAQKFMARLKNGAVYLGIGWKNTTGLSQLAGFSNSVNRIGGPAMLDGLQTMYGKPSESIGNIQFIMNSSASMRERISGSITRDQHRLLGGTGIDAPMADTLFANSRLAAKVKKTAFVPVRAYQAVVDMSTWMGAYKKAMAGRQKGIVKEDHRAAVEFADDSVVQAQAGARPVDQPPILQTTQGSVDDIFTTFTTFFISMGNQLGIGVEQGVSKRDMQAIARTMTMVYVLPALLEPQLKGYRYPDGSEEAEDGANTKLALRDLTSYPVTQVPIFGDFAEQASSELITGSSFGKVGDTPATQAMGRLGQTPITAARKVSEAVVEGGVEEGAEVAVDEAIKANTAKSIETATGLPAYKLHQIMSYIWAVATGEVDPKSAGRMILDAQKPERFQEGRD